MTLRRHLRRLVRAVRRLVAPRSQGVRRSGGWRTVEKHHLLQEPECAACGCKGSRLKPNQVHHVEPFHLAPERQILDPRNLITLCQRHHLVFGHADSWQGSNPHCREDAAVHRRRVAARS